MEIPPNQNTKNTEQVKEDLNWLLLLPSSVLFGLATVPLLLEKIGAGFYPIPGFGVIAGALGGIAAGLIQAFSWRYSKTIKTILYVIAIISVSFFLLQFSKMFPFGGAFLFLLFVMIPGLVSSLIIFSITLLITTQLTKSPVNWWLFGFLLFAGVIVSIVAMGFLSLFGAMFMAL